MASPRASMPRSPCNASAGCKKNDGVPVLDKVAEIFRPNQPGFAHASDHHAPLARKEHIDSFFKAGIQPRQDVLDCLGLYFQYASRRIETHDWALHRRTTVLSPFNFMSRLRSCDSGRALGPSERALAG